MLWETGALAVVVYVLAPAPESRADDPGPNARQPSPELPDA
jgi:hypothetical protein